MTNKKCFYEVDGDTMLVWSTTHRDVKWINHKVIVLCRGEWEEEKHIQQNLYCWGEIMEI